MSGFILFQDKQGRDRILRIRSPIFIASVIDPYDSGGLTSSKTFEYKGKLLKINLDESFQDAPESKINYWLNKAISFYKLEKNKINL